MVYPVGKVPRRHTVNDVGWDHGTAGGWNREEAPCTALAADSEARWQDVSAKGGSLVLTPTPAQIRSEQSQTKLKTNGLLSSTSFVTPVSGPGQVEEPPLEHQVGQSQQAAGQGARHQPDDQRRSHQR